jgi:hypothetical protein
LTAFGRFLSSFLNSSLSSNFVLNDVSLAVQSPENGWDERITVEHLTFLGDESETLIDLSGSGTFNDASLTLGGQIGTVRGKFITWPACQIDFPSPLLFLTFPDRRKPVK